MSNPESNESADLENYARMFKALSNPHRLRILLELLHCDISGGCFKTSSEEVKNCQLAYAESLGLAPSTVSHHFKELRQAGLIQMRREGKDVMVWVDMEALTHIQTLFQR